MSLAERRMSTRLVKSIFANTVLAITLSSLTWSVDARVAAGAKGDTFDVASIKPSAPTNGGGASPLVEYSTNSFVAHNASVKDLIKSAYQLYSIQVTGGPPWLNASPITSTDRYDIEAK